MGSTGSANLRHFGSRRGTLGLYCQQIGVRWSLDGERWERFLPNEPVGFATILVSGDEAFRELLTREDWRDLARLLDQGYEPSLALITAARSRAAG